MNRASYSTVFIAVALAACASGGGSGDGNRNSGSSGGDRNLITAEELAANSAENAFDAIQALRPTWLRSRAGGTPAPFIDGRPQGNDLSRFRSISTSSITSIRYMSPSDATTSYGTGYSSGVIEVRTR